ncbi:MAG: SRPBCC family protein [Acidobacteriota bacterium]
MSDEPAQGSTHQRVFDVDHDGQPARAVECARTFQADAATLWAALTDREQLPRWFLPIDGELRVDGRYQLEGNAGGTIQRCDAPSALDVKWEFGGGTGWVQLRLAPDADGTRLTLTHISPRDEASDKHWATYGPAATGVGWDLSFHGLGHYLAGGGAALDRAAHEAWFGTDDGKAFIRRCADAWRQAHVASGEDAAVAEGMATRTAGFYTGG